MQIRSTEEARENIINYMRRRLELDLQMDALKQDRKALQDEFKEEGVPVAIANTVLSRIKAEKKKSDAEKFEEDAIQEWAESDTEIDDKIGRLLAN